MHMKKKFLCTKEQKWAATDSVATQASLVTIEPHALADALQLRIGLAKRDQFDIPVIFVVAAIVLQTNPRRSSSSSFPSLVVGVACSLRHTAVRRNTPLTAGRRMPLVTGCLSLNLRAVEAWREREREMVREG
jgi:hypothetical protein